MSVAQPYRITPRPVAGDGNRPNRPTADGGLSRLERDVIAIGRADAQGGALVRRERGLADLLQGGFALVAGRRRPRPLADPRLEALRRFAQRAARGGEQVADLAAMRAAGYAASQIVAAARLARCPA